MAGSSKLVERFKRRPSDLRWQELVKLLGQLGYEEHEGRGSRKCFRGDGLPQIRLHKPHPDPTLKKYQVKEVYALLKEANLI